MATIELSDGRVLEFDGEPSDSDIEEAISSLGKFSAKNISPLDSAFGSAVGNLKQFYNPSMPPFVNKSFLERPAETAGVMSAALPALTSPLGTLSALATRRALGTRGAERVIDKSQNLMKRTPSIFSGSPEPITGSIGTLGEVARRLKPEQFREIPKTIAETGAFMAMRRPERAISSKLPKIFNDKWLLSQAQNAYNVANKAEETAGKEIGDFYDSFKDVPASQKEVQSVVDSLYGQAKKYGQKSLPIIDEKAMESIGEAVAADPKIGINTVWKIKQIIGNSIPSAWKKSTRGVSLTPAQQELVNDYFKLDKIIKGSLKNVGMSEEAEFLDYLNKKYSDVTRLAGVVRGMTVDESGLPVKTSQLIKTFSGGPETAGRRDLFKRLTDLEESASSISKNMKAFTGRQSLKRALKKISIATGGLGLGAWGIKSLKDVIQ